LLLLRHRNSITRRTTAGGVRAAAAEARPTDPASTPQPHTGQPIASSPAMAPGTRPAQRGQSSPGVDTTNVKNWQNGTMALRWCAAGMIEARSQFRRVNGHLHLPALRAALDAHVATETVGAVRHHEPVIAA